MKKKDKFPFVKENHVEIGVETLVFSVACCPLTEQEAEDEDCIIEVDEKRIPVCRCEELYCKYDKHDGEGPYEVLCSNFDWTVDGKIKCVLLSETDAVNIHEKSN